MNILQLCPKLLQCFGMLFHKIHKLSSVCLCVHVCERYKTNKENKCSSHLPHYYWQKTCKLDVCLLKVILLLTGTHTHWQTLVCTSCTFWVDMQLDTKYTTDWTLLYASLRPSVHMKEYTNILMCQRQNQAINKHEFVCV